MDNINQPVSQPQIVPTTQPQQSNQPVQPEEKPGVAEVRFTLKDPIVVTIDTNIGSYALKWVGKNTFIGEFSDNKTGKTFDTEFDATDLSNQLHEELVDVITKKVEKYMKRRFNEVQKVMSQVRTDYMKNLKEQKPTELTSAPSLVPMTEEYRRSPENIPKPATIPRVSQIDTNQLFNKYSPRVHNVTPKSINLFPFNFKKMDK